ncbi:MAG TPA: DUF1028 domain-containing protein [Vicinamibacterales bacterium]|nr:DUF1028 domain-containing protein [Vicinamibacterales bacterium]
MKTRLGAWGLGLGVLGLFAIAGVNFGTPLLAQDPDPVATFSILGYDPETGEVGGAVQSRVFTLTGVLTADADAGIVATQAIVDVSYGPQGIELLKKGMSPDAIIKTIWERDPDPVPDRWTKQGRQFAVMNLKGEAATFTGPKATEWAGGKLGKYAAAQGNILAGPQVVDAMLKAFEETKGHLSLRLMAALEAGQAAGGDKRGMQAAAMVIVKKGGGVWLNNDTVLRFQVDDQEDPYKELRRVVENWNKRRPNPVRPTKPPGN